MKVTRPGSLSASMEWGNGRRSSNPYGMLVYGKHAADRRREPRGSSHIIDIDSDALPEMVPEMLPEMLPKTGAAMDAVSSHGFAPDIADVFGIPQEQVTPAVAQAIGRLMTRINGLSENLTDLRQRQATLARGEDRDPFTGALSRPAFMQILENEMTLVGADRTMRTVMLCEIANLEDVLQRHGQQCKGGVFTHLRRVISEFVMPPHQLGYLGCNDFVALLYNMDGEDALQRAEAITRRVRRQPYQLKGNYITIEPVFGIHVARNGDTPVTALTAADCALRAENEMRLARLERIPRGI